MNADTTLSPRGPTEILYALQKYSLEYFCRGQRHWNTSYYTSFRYQTRTWNQGPNIGNEVRGREILCHISYFFFLTFFDMNSDFWYCNRILFTISFFCFQLKLFWYFTIGNYVISANIAGISNWERLQLNFSYWAIGLFYNFEVLLLAMTSYPQI